MEEVRYSPGVLFIAQGNSSLQNIVCAISEQESQLASTFITKHEPARLCCFLRCLPAAQIVLIVQRHGESSQIPGNTSLLLALYGGEQTPYHVTDRFLETGLGKLSGLASLFVRADFVHMTITANPLGGLLNLSSGLQTLSNDPDGVGG